MRKYLNSVSNFLTAPDRVYNIISYLLFKFTIHLFMSLLQMYMYKRKKKGEIK